MLLLIGSAKPSGQSTSEALGGYLALQLQTRGVNVTTRHVARVMRTEGRIQEFLDATNHVDLIVLAFPLYVDSLPYLVTAALERWADYRQSQIRPPCASLLAIANCGFPEALMAQQRQLLPADPNARPVVGRHCQSRYWPCHHPPFGYELCGGCD